MLAAAHAVEELEEEELEEEELEAEALEAEPAGRSLRVGGEEQQPRPDEGQQQVQLAAAPASAMRAWR